MGLGQCLICYVEVASATDTCVPLIGKQLDVIFILKELLRVPSTSLETYLEMCPGTNPSSWISLCVDCGEMIGKGRRIFDEIQNATRRFKTLQEKVVRKLKDSSVIKIERGLLDIGDMITEESRRFASEYDYGFFRDPQPHPIRDAHDQGDLEAYRRLMECSRSEPEIQPPRSIVVIKEEISDEFISADVYCDEDDDDQLPEQDWKASSHSNQQGHNLPLEYRDDWNEATTPENPLGQYWNSNAQREKRAWHKRIEQQSAFVEENGKISFRCPVQGCSKVYRSKEGFRLHTSRHSDESPKFPCNQCEKVYTSRRVLLRHKMIIHEKVPKYCKPYKHPRVERQVKCPQCDVVTDKYYLPTHINRVHKKEYSFHCGICGKGETFRTDMRRHQVEFHGICSVEGCKLPFPGDREGLRSHQLEVHGKEVDVFACEECGKCFVRLELLRSHRRFHEYKRRKETGMEGEEKQWICDHCGKTFVLKERFNSHIAAHRTKERKKLQGVKGSVDDNLFTSKDDGVQEQNNDI